MKNKTFLIAIIIFIAMTVVSQIILPKAAEDATEKANIPKPDFQYVKEVLVWDDGEIGDKVLEIPTFYVGGTAYPRTFRLKFSAQTADGYADCVTPEFVDPKVVIGLME